MKITEVFQTLRSCRDKVFRCRRYGSHDIFLIYSEDDSNPLLVEVKVEKIYLPFGTNEIEGEWEEVNDDIVDNLINRFDT